MPTAEECAYAAGFFDGEGSVYIRQPHGRAGHRSSYSICASVGQDDIRPVLFLQRCWGGCINPGPIRPNGKCNSRWTLVAASAGRFLRDILPYLIVKREQTELALEIQSQKRPAGRWKPVDDDLMERWGQIKGQVTALNVRYPGF